MKGHGGRREAGIWDRSTAIHRGEEGGDGPSRRGGDGLAEEKRRQHQQGGVPLPATGAQWPADWKCRKERDKAVYVQAAVRSVRAPSGKGWGCRGWTNGITQDSVATTMANPEMLPVGQHMDDVLI